MKMFALGAIFTAEFLAIFLEIFLAHKFEHTGTSREIIRTVFLVSPLIFACVVLLLLGYIYGIRSLSQIWLVTFVSWSSILIVEPILNYYFFQELPSGKSWLAGVLASAAIIVSVL